MMKKPARILILGCGYLGSEIARQSIREGWEVHALTRNPDTIESLKREGVQKTVCAQMSDSAWHRELNPRDYDCIVVTIGSSESSPEGYEASYIHGNRSLLQWYCESGVRVFYTSSISVYGSSQGEWVSETTSPAPENWRGECILRAETLLRESLGDRLTVFRLGGLYGPGRMRFLQRTWDPARDASSDGYLNLIHVADAAEAMRKAITIPHLPHPRFNVTDNDPRLRSQVYRRADPSDSQDAAPVSPRRRHSANRRIDASRIQKALDWKPKHRIT